MARTDWNHDGKNDMYDDYIEYKMYTDTTGNNDIPSGSSGYRRGMSAFGAVISTIGGLVAQAALYTAMDIDVEKVPALVILILWAVFTAIIAVGVDKIGL